MISRIQSATIVVSDQDAALDFYVNTLGWNKGLDANVSESMRFVTVVPPDGGAELALGLASWFDGESMPKHTGITLMAHDVEAT